jgi:hypothetical protein
MATSKAFFHTAALWSDACDLDWSLLRFWHNAAPCARLT